MSWLYLYFPQLQLDSLYFPETSMIAVVDAKSNQVVQRNYSAKKAGIEQGMGLASAASVCHQLQVIPYEPDKEQQRLAQLVNMLYGVTADIALDTPNGLYLYIGNMLSLYQGIDNYWQNISALLQQENIGFNYATASSALSAKVLATAGINSVDEEYKQQNRLGRLGIEHLLLSDKTIKILRRVGIQHIHQLLVIPLQEIAKRFDIELVNQIGWLKGELKYPLTFYQPQPYFKKSYDLLYEINNTSVLKHPLWQVLTSLEHYLHSRNLVTTELRVDLLQRNSAWVGLNIHSAQGEYKAERWQTLLMLRLESVKLQAPVVSLTLLVEQFSPNRPQEKGLFDRRQSGISVEELTSLLKAKLGENRVFTVQLKDEHRPELSSYYANTLTPKLIEQQKYALRPSYLLSQPRRLQMTTQIISEPERIQTGWWDNASLCRDYFIARNTQGQVCWVFKDSHGNWFLHGYFG